MQPILFVLPGFQPCSAVSQANVAARGLLAAGMRVHVAGWGGENFVTDQFRAAGAVVHDLGRERLLNLEHLQRLISLARLIRPESTIAWKLPALRLAGLLPVRLSGRLIGSHLIPIANGVLTQQRDRWLLGRLERLIVAGEVELEGAKRSGLPASRLLLIRPGVESAIPTGAKLSAAQLDRYVLAVGPLERSKGLQEAIWSHEILQYLFKDLRLRIAGDGPDRERLQHFARLNEGESAVHFLGALTDLRTLYAGAVAVWIPSLTDRGARVALEAMQAGRPVVATRQPRLGEIVVEGETGFVVPSGDKVALAKQTRKLLDDPQLASRMGQAGRRRAVEHFAAETYVTNLRRALEQ